MPTSELIVSPQSSASFGRLLVIIYVLTFFFVIKSSFSLLIQGVLIILVIAQGYIYLKHKKPHPEIEEIRYSQNQWKLFRANNQELVFNEAKVLIHNPLFQVVRFSQLKKKKLLILFNDQLSAEELQLIHLLSLISGI